MRWLTWFVLLILLVEPTDARMLLSGGATSIQVSYGSVFKYNSGYSTKYIVGDSFATTWSDDNGIYVMSDDSHGFQGGSDSNIQFGSLSAPDTSMTGTTINTFSIFGTNAQSGSDGGTYKANGIISVSGTLYLWVSRQGTQPVGYPASIVSEANSQLIKSTDHGSTWTPLPTNGTANPYTTTMFTNQTFSTPQFIQYGQDYQGNTVDNSNNYVYATSNEGCWNNCSKLFLGRVLISDLPSLDATKWSFYQGGDGMMSGNWGSWSTAVPLINSTNFVSNISQVQYIPGFAGGLYVWIGWYYPSIGFSHPEDTKWTLYTSPKPWGPWTERDVTEWNSEPGQGLYSPNIITKSISVVGNTATMNITCAGDFNNEDPATGDYTLTIVPLTLTVH
jgi:hypothetical protein